MNEAVDIYVIENYTKPSRRMHQVLLQLSALVGLPLVRCY